MVTSLALLLTLAGSTCDAYGSGERVGTLPITESSGLGVSIANEGVIWTHNDSGASPRFLALRADGAIALTLDVTGAEARDWEAMELGPCPEAACSCLFAGDIGDNDSVRENGVVYIIEEPAVPAGALGMAASARVLRALPFVYPNGAQNAEALMVDPLSGIPYIVSKDISARINVYRFPIPLPADGQQVTLLRVAHLSLAGSGPLGRLSTGAAVSPGGGRVILRTYKDAWEWEVPPEGLDWAFQVSPSRVDLPRRPQGEAIAYGPDGASLWISTEGEDSALDTLQCTAGDPVEIPVPALGQLCGR